ncbi:MAG: hypothetical protein ACXAEU_04250 [Candidatus Hodarchaeales archaeon]
MKTVLYLDQKSIDFEPYGSIEQLLGFKVAGKTVIQHLVDQLASGGAVGPVLVTTKQDIVEEAEKIVSAALKDIHAFTTDYIPVTSLYSLIQDVDMVMVLDGLVFPSKQDVESLLDRGMEKQMPAKLAAGRDKPVSTGLYLLGRNPSPATIDFTGTEPGDKLSKTIETHMSAQGLSTIKVAVTSPVQHLEHSWQLLNLQEKLMKGFSSSENKISGKIEPGAKLKGTGIVVKKGATIRSGSYIIGPAIIDENAVIGPNCFIRPCTFIDKNVVIGNAVEIKNSILLEGTHVGHLSYVGDSIIGKDCNFGAGTKIANLNFNDTPVKVTSSSSGEKISTSRRKLGVLMGHGVKTGINSSLMPGIKIGNNSVIGAGFLLQSDLESEHVVYLDENQKPMKKKRKSA